MREKQYQRGLMTLSHLLMTEQDESIMLYPHKMFFLNPFYFSDKTPQGLKDWMTLVTESVNNPRNPNINLQRPIIQKAAQLIDDDGLTPQERVSILDEHDFNRRMNKELTDALQQRNQEIARSLLAEGIELTLIAKTTGLSIAEIEALS